MTDTSIVCLCELLGTDLILSGDGNALVIPFEAGAPIIRSSSHTSHAVPDDGDRSSPGAGDESGGRNTDIGAEDGFVVLQGVLTGMRQTTQIDDSSTNGGKASPSKGKGIRRMRSIANSVTALHSIAFSSAGNDESKSFGNYDHGWQVEVEVAIGTCPDSNCLDHFGIGAKSVVPCKSMEQNKVLVREGPFGSGNQFAGKKIGKFLAPPHFISPATSPKPAYVCKIGTKIVVKERGPLYGYCATILGHSGMRTLTEIRDSK